MLALCKKFFYLIEVLFSSLYSFVAYNSQYNTLTFPCWIGLALLPSIFAVLARREVEICDALLSKANLNCCDDHDKRFSSISRVQHVPRSDDDGQMDKETSEKKKNICSHLRTAFKWRHAHFCYSIMIP